LGFGGCSVGDVCGVDGGGGFADVDGAADGDGVRSGVPACAVFFSGAMVGVLTGFLGVGGGFLLMPALVRFAKLPMGMAMGTSLAVIAFNSLAGFLSHAGEAKIQWAMTGVFVVMAVAGVLAGGVLAKRLPERLLKRVFGGLVLVTALVVFWSVWV
jgi:uncharacterized membrane protein YfcA